MYTGSFLIKYYYFTHRQNASSKVFAFNENMSDFMIQGQNVFNANDLLLNIIAYSHSNALMTELPQIYITGAWDTTSFN